jgi:hypothetical protein
MNAYLVRIPEQRLWRTAILDDGTGPDEPYMPLGIFVAGSPAAAKHDALKAWTQSSCSGVYHDDWPALRVATLEHDVDLLESTIRRGELHEDGCAPSTWKRLWARADEILAAVAA